ncbi:PLDc N-terminal domain-containing protein [Microbacterium schleiferi]|uniref:PLDc N-terminal domain-containing protein n=1 Tax=Microbacterium schleiferi TaxID=69362 RepID=A0A7S8MX50_9MICO|nr:PLDc N-terminal domain-containing protein [Microbacterium schleiferi]QPE04020.1 PLDc N-terminal domain-containing protein [Microbacterium schleiferi]
MAAHNPLLPAAYDIAWSAIAAVALALTVVALIALVRSAGRLPAGLLLLWALLILFVPVVGPALWLTAGRRTNSTTSGNQPERIRSES